MSNWMWYPGDFECRLMRNASTNRYERDMIVPPFWRIDDCYDVVTFACVFELERDDVVTFKCEGEMLINYDSYQTLTGFDGTLHIPKGKHFINIRLYGKGKIPALSVSGKELCSSNAWTVSCNDHVHHTVSIGNNPNKFKLSTENCKAKNISRHDDGVVYDFGREMMGQVALTASGPGKIKIYYGESLEECLDSQFCELIDTIVTTKAGKVRTRLAKAFRYVYIILENNITVKDVFAISEYLPVTNKGKFVTNDQLINSIYDVSIHTLHLCSRELFIDGIKRDRWAWSGDAYQSYLMNYYSFSNNDAVKRTMLGLRGKEPTMTHTNHIVDYTFFWIIAFVEYCENTNDIAFCSQFFGRATSLMDFCIGRTNSRGLIEGLPNDWVFVDWANIDNRGEVCYENILYYQSLKKLSQLCDKLGDKNSARYAQLAEQTIIKINQYFWCEDKKSYIYNIYDGIVNEDIRRQPNIMAILLDICDEGRKKEIINSVLKNNSVDKILTPYMRFFELAALAKMGEMAYVMEEIRAYWGGMLDEGATSFWEKYDPNENGIEKYAMYDRKFGKSLCHAWGASPIFLLGRFVTGVERVPYTTSQFTAKPYLGFEFSATVPLEVGSVEVELKNQIFKAKANNCSGDIVINDTIYHIAKNKTLEITI